MSSRGVPPPTITPGTSHLLFFGSNIFTLNLVCEIVRLAREQRNDSREICTSVSIYTLIWRGVISAPNGLSPCNNVKLASNPYGVVTIPLILYPSVNR